MRRYDAVSLNQEGDPLSSGVQKTPRFSCLYNQRRVRIEIKTDKYGYETSYVFRKKGKTEAVFQGPDANYESSTLYKGTISTNAIINCMHHVIVFLTVPNCLIYFSYKGAICVDIGMYEFEIKGMSLCG